MMSQKLYDVIIHSWLKEVMCVCLMNDVITVRHIYSGLQPHHVCDEFACLCDRKFTLMSSGLRSMESLTTPSRRGDDMFPMGLMMKSRELV